MKKGTGLRSLFCCLLVLLVLMTQTMPAAHGEEDAQVLDEEELNRWMESFLQERNLDADNITVSVGFWYSGTGESWYYDADRWMYAESLYKVPVAMLLAEKEAAGELSRDSIIYGITLEFAEESALVRSNEDSGVAMVVGMGGNKYSKCSEMTIQYTDLPEDYFPDEFRSNSFYSARYMTQVMKTLYEGGEERFPYILGYMKQCQPIEYFKRAMNIRFTYDVAQRFGAYRGDPQNKVHHNTGIIYTPTPIVVTVMTRNVDDYPNVIAAIGSYFADYSKKLDARLGKPVVETEPVLPDWALALMGESEETGPEETAAETEDTAAAETETTAELDPGAGSDPEPGAGLEPAAAAAGTDLTAGMGSAAGTPTAPGALTEAESPAPEQPEGSPAPTTEELSAKNSAEQTEADQSEEAETTQTETPTGLPRFLAGIVIFDLIAIPSAFLADSIRHRRRGKQRNRRQA